MLYNYTCVNDEHCSIGMCQEDSVYWGLNVLGYVYSNGKGIRFSKRFLHCEIHWESLLYSLV